jgi:hypothetical protein
MPVTIIISSGKQWGNQINQPEEPTRTTNQLNQHNKLGNLKKGHSTTQIHQCSNEGNQPGQPGHLRRTTNQANPCGHPLRATNPRWKSQIIKSISQATDLLLIFKIIL